MRVSTQALHLVFMEYNTVMIPAELDSSTVTWQVAQVALLLPQLSCQSLERKFYVQSPWPVWPLKPVKEAHCLLHDKIAQPWEQCSQEVFKHLPLSSLLRFLAAVPSLEPSTQDGTKGKRLAGKNTKIITFNFPLCHAGYGRWMDPSVISSRSHKVCTHMKTSKQRISRDKMCWVPEYIRFPSFLKPLFLKCIGSL